jgi:hypothetical protein
VLDGASFLAKTGMLFLSVVNSLANHERAKGTVMIDYSEYLEGFSGIFISTINNVLADHIAKRLEFAVDDGVKTIYLEEPFHSGDLSHKEN